MERITHYKLEEDGTYTAVVKGLSLGNDETQMLDNGFTVGVDVNVHDPYRISSKQRKKIFALCNDIERHTGTPSELMRRTFINYLKIMNGTEEEISLSNCSKRTASDLIQLIIYWIFEHNIPLDYRTSDLMKEDNTFLYLSTINRICVVCGAINADIAHEDAVGAGRNRQQYDHTGHRVLALCRSCHNEQHQIGIKTFNKKYHLENAWLLVNDKLNQMLKGKKLEDIKE